MRIIKSLKFAEDFDEELDHFTDNTLELLTKHESDKSKIQIDYDSLEDGQRPIGDDNLDDNLAEII